MQLKCHLYQIDGISSMRDLGGYSTKSGKKTALGRFMRSTALAYLDESGVEELLKLNIDCVIDLRSTKERTDAPDVVEGNKAINFVHVPLLDQISSNTSDDDYSHFPGSMTEMYIGLLDGSGDIIKTAFKVFADEKYNRYLFHCTAGKDRTGITAMLLLGLAGVPDEIIIEDYSYTEYLLEDTPLAAAANKGIPHYLFESAPATMQATINHIKNNYGGYAEYLDHIGIDERERQIIINKLLA